MGAEGGLVGQGNRRSEVRRSEFIPGNQVYLRPLELADAEAVCEWMNDREVLRFLPMTVPINRFREEEFLKTLYQDMVNLHLGIVRRGDSHLIGTVSLADLDVISRHARLSLIVGEKAAWGKGFGREADSLMVGYGFEFLNLHRIYAYVLAGHEASLKVLYELRFAQEGMLRQHIYRDGRYHDVVIMGLLREAHEGGSPFIAQRAEDAESKDRSTCKVQRSTLNLARPILCALSALCGEAFTVWGQNDGVSGMVPVSEGVW
ncbi:MAG: GNAT family N-acetyltransferase [Nitrospinae bacterium]|nr:GNAT family N-acetyltransferase [Nitrospinota bacterium]